VKDNASEFNNWREILYFIIQLCDISKCLCHWYQ